MKIMAYKEIGSYALVYHDRPAVYVRLIGESLSRLILPAPSDAVFVTDMLRNEKPVYFSWSPESQSIRLSTNKEPVGEQELRRLFSFLYV